MTLSVIVPVLNEAHQLSDTLAPLQTLPDVEIIVVDGGSRDDTVAVARSLGVQVIETTPGRAHQMNQGAAAATGAWLLFLHGDTRLPAHAPAHVQTVLAQPGVVAGAFDLRIAATGWGLRWIERGVWARSRLCQLPYGDQALFLRTTTFRQVGGFPELPIMEDFVLVQRLKRLGRIAIAPACVTTSPRRWQKLGVPRTTLINQLMIVGYYLGFSPHRLVRWYRTWK